MARYKIAITVDGSNIRAVQAACKKAFGADVSAQVEKIESGTRADRLSDAESTVDDAKTEVEGLRDELQEWHDNLPENLQGGDKASELDDAIQELETIISALEEVDFSNVSFPGMM